MDLYVANTSKQHRILYFRLPEKPLQRYVINAGQQGLLYRGPFDMVEGIIAQIVEFGARSVNEVKRADAHIGITYSVDKVITAEMMMVADEHNMRILDQWGVEMRQRAAIGNSEIVDKAMHGKVTAFEQEVFEDRQRGVTHETLIDRLHVSRTEGGSTPRGRRRKAA